MTRCAVRPRARALAGLAVAALVLGVTACSPGADTDSATAAGPQTTATQSSPTTAGPTRTRTTPTPLPTTGSTGLTGTIGPTTSPAPPGTSTATPTGSPTTAAARTDTPQPSYSPPTICPDITAIKPTFTVEPIGVDPASGADRVRVVMTYTNPMPHALFLMGSLGYVDSEGYESDLYSTPGDLIFEDVRLERGTGTLTRDLEDIYGEATDSSLYFTYWALAGTAVDSSRPIPCDTNRGYSSH